MHSCFPSQVRALRMRAGGGSSLKELCARDPSGGMRQRTNQKPETGGGGLKAANQSRGSFKGTADMKFSVAGDPRKSKRGARSLQRALMLNSSDNFAFVL